MSVVNATMSEPTSQHWTEGPTTQELSGPVLTPLSSGKSAVDVPRCQVIPSADQSTSWPLTIATRSPSPANQPFDGK
jgi:hypothetical protein